MSCTEFQKPHVSQPSKKKKAPLAPAVLDDTGAIRDDSGTIPDFLGLSTASDRVRLTGRGANLRLLIKAGKDRVAQVKLESFPKL